MRICRIIWKKDVSKHWIVAVESMLHAQGAVTRTATDTPLGVVMHVMWP